MQFHGPIGDRKTDSRALLLPVTRTIGAIKGAQDGGQFMLRNAWPIICHTEHTVASHSQPYF